MGNWKNWAHGLGAAIIGAAASGVTSVIVDPATFNFTHAGILKLAQVCAVQSALAAALYLKQSPLPS